MNNLKLSKDLKRLDEMPTNPSPSTTATSPEDPNTRTYSVRVPKTTSKQNNLMRFNGALKVDFGKWSNVKMVREDNSALHKLPDWSTTEMPKFGAGSEFGREQREEARRRKYGANARKYKPENQPWILKVGTGETAKKFKGVREGGVNDNASYFIFTQAQNGTFEVFPIKEWFNFTPIQRYKSLTAEEAEEQFSKRNKIMNLFSVMVSKRLKDDKEEADEDGRGDKTTAKKEKGDMKVTDMDDWIVDEEEEDSDEDEDGNKKEKKPTKKKGQPKKKNKKGDSDDDPLEDSDDGDEEGREQDYMTDVSSSSEDEEEKKPDLQGVDQDDALRALLESESSSEEDEESKSEEKKDEEPVEGEKKKKSKKKKKKHESKEEVKSLTDAPVLMNDPGIAGDDGAETKPDPAVPEVKTEATVKEEGNPGKRKAVDYELIGNSSKKHKVEVPQSTLQLAASEGITEETVKKYLQRKPMTIAELLQKFKLKKSKISSNDLVPVIAHILKKLNPTKRNQQNKTYFFINPQ